MKLLKALFFVVLFVLTVVSVNAQNQSIATPVNKSLEDNSKSNNREITPQFSTTSVERNSETVGQTILQEIFLIDDQRQNIEKNQSLSSSDRNQQIQENNNNYLVKKAEFVNYIVSKGIMNVTKKEQNYYLYILKNDKNDKEYSRIVELIKNTEQ